MQSNSETEVTSQVVNPKDKWGLAKPGISSIPPVAIAVLGQGMAEGERKYGHTNWRETKVTARLYYEAAQRHLMAWLDGQTLDPATGIHHLGLAMADLAIIIDGEFHGKLVDDRTTSPGPYPAWLDQNTVKKDPNASAKPPTPECAPCRDCIDGAGCMAENRCKYPPNERKSVSEVTSNRDRVHIVGAVRLDPEQEHCDNCTDAAVCRTWAVCSRFVGPKQVIKDGIVTTFCNDCSNTDRCIKLKHCVKFTGPNI